VIDEVPLSVLRVGVLFSSLRAWTMAFWRFCWRLKDSWLLQRPTWDLCRIIKKEFFGLSVVIHLMIHGPQILF